MVSKEQGNVIHAAEVARQTAPDKLCYYCLTHGDGYGRPHKQIVKIGAICPVCGRKVE